MGLILCALCYASEVNVRWRLMCVFKTIIHRSNFEDSLLQVWVLIFECHIVSNDCSGLLLQNFVINIERLLRTKDGSYVVDYIILYGTFFGCNECLLSSVAYVNFIVIMLKWSDNTCSNMPVQCWHSKM